MKKIIAIFILTFMLSGLLIGCGNVENQGADQGGASENTGGNDSGQDETPGGEDIIPGGEDIIPGGEDIIPGDEDIIPDDGDNTPSDSDVNGIPDGDFDVNDEGETSDKEDNTQGGEDITDSTPENPFSDLTLEKVGGGSVNTADYRGKILVLNIWATWCPPCKAELPDFDKIAKDFAEDVVIIAAHTPSGRQNAQSYVAENFPDTNIIFAYDSDSSDAFLAAGGGKYVPRTVVIDRNGGIVYGQDGLMSYEALYSIIEDIK